ncbi:hypothetical protein A2164_04510 [Candidatus Curtissbacteria bacterium RBG_13_35_7]|uniref:Methyltransferase domain-containing protein n=1 Tax=Candidatus Curtissbacteria bacterium RBG_13_35_7 TaxID=1797705 RepID=A0A1F5G0D2_9BACT|nr:MAG: hypothetical protein A2164_04510 [Candidatus Curtissbacteria bacterium RBG_13_35_7]
MTEAIIAIILIIITALLLFVILMGVFYTIDLFLDLPYVGTQHHKIETIIKLAQIKKGETAVDLGSGDGRLLYAAAQKGAKAIGYELNPFLIVITLIHTKLKGLGNEISIERKNLWQADLKVADVIFVYSLKKSIAKFEEYVYKNATPGTRVIVNLHPFPNKKPLKQKDGIYLYKI